MAAPVTAQDAVRVCHVIHALRRGGAERVLVDLAQVAASHAGIEMHVLCLMEIDQEMPYAAAIAEKGVQVSTLGLNSRWDPRGLRRIAAAVEKLRPDVIHAHMRHADVLGAAASKRLGIPLVSTLHIVEQPTSAVEVLKARVGARARLSAARRTIAVSDAQRRWYLEAVGERPERVITIPNGVLTPPSLSSAERREIRAGLGVPDDAVMVTMVGVMRPGKGHAELLATADAIAGRDDVVFVIVGDGPLRPEIDEAVSRGRARIVLTGFREDVWRILAASDMAVHPSLADALPTAVIEELAAGLPVVASDVGGIPDIVTPDCGVLVPTGDVGALAGAVVELVGDSERRRVMGAAGRERFRTTFEAGLWAQRLSSLYRAVLDESGVDASRTQGRSRARRWRREGAA